MKHKFWKFCRDEATGGRVLKLNGVISDETWYGDEVTPGIFSDELHEGEGTLPFGLIPLEATALRQPRFTIC